jgi:hypothetical protein
MLRPNEETIEELKRAAGIVEHVAEELESAETLLTDADNIGVWVESDGCGDNRERRQKLREASGDVGAAALRLERAAIELPDISAMITALGRGANALSPQIDAVAGSITDTMAQGAVRADIIKLTDQTHELLGRARSLAEECRRRIRRREQFQSAR